jgi:predicted ABC-type ATPase
MVVIHLEQAELNAARVAQRVREGGHSVTSEKVIPPIPRMLPQVKASIPICDQVRVLDNSSADDPFPPVVTIKNGSAQQHQRPLLCLAAELLD